MTLHRYPGLAEWTEDRTIALERQGKTKRALTVANVADDHLA
jgi:hypothetical protein